MTLIVLWPPDLLLSEHMYHGLQTVQLPLCNPHFLFRTPVSKSVVAEYSRSKPAHLFRKLYISQRARTVWLCGIVYTEWLLCLRPSQPFLW